jgi:hypothetical protein
MGTLKRILVAWTAAALLAVPAVASDYWSDGADAGAPKKIRKVQYNSAGRKVTVWRDLSKGQPEVIDPNNPFEGPDAGDAAQEEMPTPPPEPGGHTPHAPHHSSGLGCTDAVSDGWDDSGFGGCGAGGCGAGGCCSACPFWTHRTNFFGEYLYLQAANVDMPHAIQVGDTGGPDLVPLGPVVTSAPQWTPAYRVGFAFALSDCASVGASYTNFHSHIVDTVEAEPDTAFRSLVFQPGTVNAGTLAAALQATYVVDFQTVDIEYRGLLWGGNCSAGNFIVGGRYGKLVQNFEQLSAFVDEAGGTLTGTNITFEGGGLRMGLDAERKLGASRFSIYGKSFANLLFGQFRSSYVELDSTTESTLQAFSTWTDNRVVPVLEVQAGINWTSWNGRWRTSTGYYAAFWTNSVTTQDFIHAVQTSNFNNLGQTVAFEGLVSRLEFRF